LGSKHGKEIEKKLNLKFCRRISAENVRFLNNSLIVLRKRISLCVTYGFR
jgi:hypothetical protein